MQIVGQVQEDEVIAEFLFAEMEGMRIKSNDSL
jgi:hypothetical protein